MLTSGLETVVDSQTLLLRHPDRSLSLKQSFMYPSLVWIFYTGKHGLILTILLPPPTGTGLLHSVYVVLGIEPMALCMLPEHMTNLAPVRLEARCFAVPGWP